MDRSLLRAFIAPRIYFKHIALASSICESSTRFEEVRCDALVENEVWVDYETTIGSDMQIAGLAEL